MLTIYSDDHHLHHGRCELMDGQLMPCFEMPSRADHVLQRVKDRQLGPVQPPRDFGLAPLQRIHSRDYLDFFQGHGRAGQSSARTATCCPTPGPRVRCERCCPPACMAS